MSAEITKISAPKIFDFGTDSSIVDVIRTMQTFLPYADFHESAACLNNRRLGKQRVEVLQLLQTIRAGTGSWYSHPAAQQWIGCSRTLVRYGIAICQCWISKDYRDGCLPQIAQFRWGTSKVPAWLGYEPYHASHRSVLLRKGLEDETFCRFRNLSLEDKLDFPSKKSQWLPSDYEKFWTRFGKPKLHETHYGQFGWLEKPAVPTDRGSTPYVWPSKINLEPYSWQPCPASIDAIYKLPVEMSVDESQDD